MLGSGATGWNVRSKLPSGAIFDSARPANVSLIVSRIPRSSGGRGMCRLVRSSPLFGEHCPAVADVRADGRSYFKDEEMGFRLPRLRACARSDCVPVVPKHRTSDRSPRSTTATPECGLRLRSYRLH